jgi:hypothetical protein
MAKRGNGVPAGETPPAKKKAWWQTLPAIITALATLVGSITGLLVVLWSRDPVPMPVTAEPAPATSTAVDPTLLLPPKEPPIKPPVWVSPEEIEWYHSDGFHWHQIEDPDWEPPDEYLDPW